MFALFPCGVKTPKIKLINNIMKRDITINFKLSPSKYDNYQWEIETILKLHK